MVHGPDSAASCPNACASEFSLCIVGLAERTAAGVTLFRLEGGKIVESWNYDNALELEMQGGKRPPAT
jgi:hypothetical protein